MEGEVKTETQQKFFYKQQEMYKLLKRDALLVLIFKLDIFTDRTD